MKEMVNSAARRIAPARARLALGKADKEDSGDHQPDSTEGADRDYPHRPLPISGAQLRRGAAPGKRLNPALSKPGAGSNRVTEQGKTAEQKNREGGAQRQQVDVLGRRHHKFRPAQAERAESRLYPKGADLTAAKPVPAPSD